MGARFARVMIACCVNDTVRIIKPALFYDVGCVHLLHYYQEGYNRSDVYLRFFQKVRSDLESSGIEVIEHNCKVFYFDAVLREIESIIESEHSDSDCSIYVNLSVGTTEYIGAASIASMMRDPDASGFHRNIMPFYSRGLEYRLDQDSIQKVYFEDDVPVGEYSDARDPQPMPVFSIVPPDGNLVKALRLLRDRQEQGLSTTGAEMTSALIDAGLWRRDPNKTNPAYYVRDFAEKWENNGWIVRNPGHGAFSLTGSGKLVVDSFYH